MSENGMLFCADWTSTTETGSVLRQCKSQQPEEFLNWRAPEKGFVSRSSKYDVKSYIQKKEKHSKFQSAVFVSVNNTYQK